MGPVGPAGPLGPVRPAGQAGPAGKAGTFAFAAKRTTVRVRRGRTASWSFAVANDTGAVVGRSTATATAPKALRASGVRPVSIASLAIGQARTVRVSLKVGTGARLGTHAVKVRLKVGGTAVTRTVKVTVRR